LDAARGVRKAAMLATIVALAAGFSSPASGPADLCSDASHCTVEGQLTMMSYSGEGQATELVVGDRCMALALPRAMYHQGDALRGKWVRVSGSTTSQPGGIEPPDVLMWYMAKDRQVSMGVCPTGPVMYVKRLTVLKRPTQ
jgi:hypothetical protein